jgi:rhodanese-related sulfurtransferase
MQQLRVTDLASWLKDAGRPQPVLLDVREPWEFELGHLPGATPMPMNLVPLQHADLPSDRDIVVVCHHGMRSMQVAMFLERQGFSAIHNLTGGMDAWSCEVDPAVARY